MAAGQSREELLERTISRLGGEADPEASSLRSATAPERDAGEEEAVPVAPPPVDVGWVAWLGDPEGDLEGRKWGIVVDAAGADSVVVLRSRKRRERMEAWLEVWPISGLDPVNTQNPGSSKRIQAAKAACEAIAAGKATGRWGDKDEELLAAIAVLTAPFSGGKRSA